MNESYFKRLLEDYLTGQLSGPDQKQFFQLLEDDKYRVLLEEALYEEWQKGSYEEMTDPELANLVEQSVLNRIQEEKSAPVRNIPFFKRYIVAAAAILILVLGAVWFLYQKNDGDKALHSATKLPAKIEVNPGTNGAVLTLADGSKLILDSAGNGLITNQGNAKVVKLSDGQLAYQVNGNQVEILYNTLTTDRGKQFHVRLPDGTDVWLNAASSLRFPTAFIQKQRKVELTGEAYFEVRKNAAQPFVVVTRGQEITVLGTHFNVNSYDDEGPVRTTLLEGSVKIATGKDQVLIEPGEQGVVMNDNIKIQHVNVDDVVAWKNGFFSFRQTNVKGIMRQLGRWYDVDVSYQGLDPDETFTGKIDRNLNLTDVLKILEKTGVHFKLEENKRLVILP